MDSYNHAVISAPAFVIVCNLFMAVHSARRDIFLLSAFLYFVTVSPQVVSQSTILVLTTIIYPQRPKAQRYFNQRFSDTREAKHFATCYPVLLFILRWPTHLF